MRENELALHHFSRWLLAVILIQTKMRHSNSLNYFINKVFHIGNEVLPQACFYLYTRFFFREKITQTQNVMQNNECPKITTI